MCLECSTRRANRVARKTEQAERIGQLQKFIVQSPLFPAVVVVGFFALIGFVTYLVESIRL
jgi:hypothetical protein